MKLTLRAAQLIAVLAIAACLYTMFGRFGYTCDLEWMTGSIFDAVQRIHDGKPLYTAPSIAWTPFMYPPLYFWIVAKLMGAVSFYTAARSVSIAATLVQAACVWRLAGHHGASREWKVIGVGVFFAAFGVTSFWYDLERVDSLFVAMMATGVVLLVERRGLVATFAAAALMGLGFFAKQPALAFLGGIVFALAMTRQWTRAIVFAITSGAVVVGGVLWLQAKTDGWYGYYCLHMPRAHGIVPSLFKVVFFEDVPRSFALVGAAVYFFVRWALARAKGGGDENALLACTFGVAGIASGSSRVHFGGWDNVLMFFTTFGAVAVAIVGTELSARWKDAKAGFLVPFAVGLQMIIWAYDPTNMVPPRSIVSDARLFEAKVKELEKEGEVIVTGRGHVTAEVHAHQAALIDVFRTEHVVPETLAKPFRDRQYAAIVIDNFDDLQLTFIPGMNGKLFNVVMAYYYVSERLTFWMPDAPIGFHTHPRLVLRRRTEPLDEGQPEMIRCRAKTERALAETRERAERGGAKEPARPDIEALARDACNVDLAGVTWPKGFWVDDDPVLQ